MKVNLNREELLTLLESQEPDYISRKHPLISNKGKLDGDRDGEFWRWDHDSFKKTTDKKIFCIYLMCKNNNREEPVINTPIFSRDNDLNVSVLNSWKTILPKCV